MSFQKEKPAFVYKYCSAQRAAQVVQDLKFYFAPVTQLNDLFEFRAASVYQETVDSKYRVFAKRLIADRWFSDFSQAFEVAKSLDSREIDLAYSFFLNQLSAMLAKVMRYSGVVCFTAERNNQRMWGTYGDKHTGAVLEFSTSTELSRFAAHLMPVIYTDTKLPICPSELMTERLTIDQWMLGVFLCVKHIHWREESEWRLLLLADAEQTVEERLVPFERSALTRIFLGPRISPDQESLIRNAATKQKPAVPVFKRRIDDALATEEYSGVELIHSFDQLMYWAKASKPNK
jgi:hypothetical protein